MPRGSSRPLKRTDHLDLPRHRSVMGQKRKSAPAILTSVLPSTADIRQRGGYVRKVPISDMAQVELLIYWRHSTGMSVWCQQQTSRPASEKRRSGFGNSRGSLERLPQRLR
jgi:hypothetical protein